MVKNNTWNKLLHAADVKAAKELMNEVTNLLKIEDIVRHKFSLVDSLTSALEFHKEIWKLGIQNENIGPCPYGIFRTKDIVTMKPEEVFLGNIWGMWTNNIPFWMEHSEEIIGSAWGIDPNTKCVDLVLDQYLNILESNINALYKKYNKEYNELKKLGY